MKRFLLISALVCSTSLLAQVNCLNTNRAFSSGEKLVYSVNYNWGLIWVESGTATFSVASKTQNNKTLYQLAGVGSTFEKYDWFFKVRDKFESLVDTATLLPLRYTRNTNEGSTHIYNDSYFDYRKKKITCYSFDENSKVKKDSIPMQECVYDVLSMIYYSRTIDFSKSRSGDKVPINLYLDGKIYNLHITYLGKEKLKLDGVEYNTIKFQPKLIEGTIFKGGDKMTVWVTDDKKKVPIFIETPIMVGSIKVKLNFSKSEF